MKTSLRQIRQDLKQPHQLALLLVALIPLFPEYISFFLVIAAAVLAFCHLRVAGKKLAIGTIGKLMLAYIGYTAFTLLYSQNRFVTLCNVGMWAFFFLVYLILYNLLTDTDRYDSMMLYITGVAGLVGLIACLQYRICLFTNSNFIEVWGWLDDIVFPLIPLDLTVPEYVMRSCSTFTNPNSLSMYLTAVAPFVVYFNFYERRDGLRLFCRICLFLCFGGVIFSFCRGGYLAILLLAIALLLLNIRHRFTTVSLYAMCTALLIPDEVFKRFVTIIPGISLGEQLLDNSSLSTDITHNAGELLVTPSDIINSSTADLAVNDRYRMWLEAMESIGNRPIFGHGMGNGVSQEILADAGINAPHSHNIVLELLLGGGIIALIIMALIGFKAVKNGIELMRNGYGYSFWIGFAVLGFAACFCIQGMVDHPLLTPKLVANFMMVMALIERANYLYTAKGIAVRQKLRKTLLAKVKQP
ncbi:MAG: O-antigen ligase family protein [Clostridia bacterium]|nr:O-antigen ligase family protein [Clostridia bacterium]